MADANFSEMGLPGGLRPSPAGVREAVAQRLERMPGEALHMRALLLGARIDTRGLPDFVDAERLPEAPGGAVFVFRYGAVVLFGVSPESESAIVARLLPHVTEPLDRPETESVGVRIAPTGEEQVEGDGCILLRDSSAQRLLLLATVLARSVVLARDEVRIADAFERIDPLVQQLRTQGRTGQSIRRVMQHIGEVLSTRHRMVGRAQIGEKPELLWDHPELERLYVRLETEYELDERAVATERKLDAIGDAADVLADLIHAKRSERLELAIIALIMFEIALTLLERAGF